MGRKITKHQRREYLKRAMSPLSHEEFEKKRVLDMHHSDEPGAVNSDSGEELENETEYSLLTLEQSYTKARYKKVEREAQEETDTVTCGWFACFGGTSKKSKSKQKQDK